MPSGGQIYKKFLCFFFFILSSGGVAAHTLEACLAHSRFRPTTQAYSQGKFLTNAAQHRYYPKSVRYGRAGIQTKDPVVGYFGLALSCIFGRTSTRSL